MIHRFAEVQSESIGKNTRIWQYVVILEKAVIGDNCNICSHCFIENEVVIGDNVTVKSGVQFWDGIRVENNVFVGPNVTFTNDVVPRSMRCSGGFLKKNILIKEGASIGANATIIGGLTIGCYAMIGAGSVLTKNVPDYTLWYGNPAQCKGYVCCCGNKIENDLICGVCNIRYREEQGIINPK